MFLICLISIISLLYVFFELKRLPLKNAINKFHGPKPLPLVGNALHAGKNGSELLQNVFHWWREAGYTNYRLWVAYTPYVYICTPEDMEFVLSSNTLISKSEIYDMLYPWLGQGLLTATGSHWQKHRKMITPTFHFNILQDFHKSMNRHAEKFIGKLRAASKDEQIFDVQAMVSHFTLDLICDTAMGVNINSMDNNDSNLVLAFKTMCENTLERCFHPLYRRNFWYKFSADYPKYEKALTDLQTFTYEVIEQRLKLHETLKTAADQSQSDEIIYTKNKMAFLDTLLTAKVDDKPLTNQEIYEEVSTFIFEGHDTTTSGIAFLIYMLSRHPRIQQKVLQEQIEIMQGDMQRNASYQEIAEMKYLDLAIKECLRLYPSVPVVARACDKDYMMNGKLLPKGTYLNLMVIIMGYNSQIFKDPYICRPERFSTAEAEAKLNPFAYVPFSAGPRNCIGQKFALLEIKTIISKIVRAFEILPPLDELVSPDGSVQHYFGLDEEQQRKRYPNPSKYDPVLAAVITLKSDNGIQIRLRERK